MKASVSYNFFNGEEFLKRSIEQIRPVVEHINVVFQKVSNRGLPASADQDLVMQEVRDRGLVDRWIEYSPDHTIHPVFNELKKRQIGLDAALEDGATHFMTMDADEFYVTDEFLRARRFLESEDVVASSVKTYLHIKKPIWRSRDPEPTNCCFLSRVEPGQKIVFDDTYPVLVDPTRRISTRGGRHHYFDEADIAMYHMNMVRRDLDHKLNNSSSADNVEFMDKVRQMYRQWEFGQPLYFPNKPPLEIIQVEDRFNLANGW